MDYDEFKKRARESQKNAAILHKEVKTNPHVTKEKLTRIVKCLNKYTYMDTEALTVYVDRTHSGSLELNPDGNIHKIRFDLENEELSITYLCFNQFGNRVESVDRREISWKELDLDYFIKRLMREVKLVAQEELKKDEKRAYQKKLEDKVYHILDN